MNTNCNACGVRVQVDIEQLAGIRYCPKCQWRAKATWTLRTAALWAERAGLEEASEIRALAGRIAIPGSLTRDEVLTGNRRPRRVA